MSVKPANESVLIPAWVKDLDSFRRWTHSDGFPQYSKISYLAGDI